MDQTVQENPQAVVTARSALAGALWHRGFGGRAVISLEELPPRRAAGASWTREDRGAGFLPTGPRAAWQPI